MADEEEKVEDLIFAKTQAYETLKEILIEYEKLFEKLRQEHKLQVELTRKGDVDLDPGVIRHAIVRRHGAGHLLPRERPGAHPPTTPLPG